MTLVLLFYVSFHLFGPCHHFLQLGGEEEKDDGCGSTHEYKYHEEVEKVFHLIAEEAFLNPFFGIVAAQKAGQFVGC